MDDTASETVLQAFVRALYEARDASEAVDHFDLHSENETSLQKWNRLLDAQRKAFRALHEICCRSSVDDLLG